MRAPLAPHHDCQPFNSESAMPHDFARQREARATRAGKPPIAPWLWFSSGAVIGAFCSFLLFLSVGVPQSPVAPSTTAPDEKEQAAPAEAAPPAKPVEKQYKFYTLLTQSEMIVGTRPGETDGGDTAAPSTPPNVEPSELLLQAGSFRQQAQAEQRRADIILLGYEARVETVSIDNDGSWYRVLVGPFSGADRLTEARHSLLEQGFDTLEISKRSR
jgi:cell division protein FtsN